MNPENLGPAERTIQTLISYTDHLFHGRPGLVHTDNSAVGVKWQPAVKKDDGIHTYQNKKMVLFGQLDANGKVQGWEYRKPGIFPEVVKWMYEQIVDIWKLDNEFAARWASYAFTQTHRDLKVILAAFLSVQSRKGDPVVDGDKIAFYDEDYRDVGEAMMLLPSKDFHPKVLLRIREVLSVPAVAKINNELGFGKSDRHPFLGRWTKIVEKWLNYREENPKLLESAIKAGFRTSIIKLAQAVGYRPNSSKFFEALRWKQVQAKDGRRLMAIGEAVRAAESWSNLNEQQICEAIVEKKPNFKLIVGRLPKAVGLTRAIVAAAIEAGSFSDKDLVLYTPTLEEFGLLSLADIRARWEKAVQAAEDMRAANIATRVKSQATKDKLQEGADKAIQKAVEEVVKGIRVYVMVDISGSMQGAIEAAKEHIAKFLQSFPLDSMHVAVFNTTAREVTITHPSAAGVNNAFRGIAAGGGTDYGAGVRVLARYKPKPDEDVLFFFVGDEEAPNFENAVKASGLNPMAFGLIRMVGQTHGMQAAAVRFTARQLGIPCFLVTQETFSDPYSIPRTIRNLIAATPVQQRVETVAPKRITLIDTIIQTQLLRKPAWA